MLMEKKVCMRLLKNVYLKAIMGFKKNRFFFC